MNWIRHDDAGQAKKLSHVATSRTSALTTTLCRSSMPTAETRFRDRPAPAERCPACDAELQRQLRAARSA